MSIGIEPAIDKTDLLVKNITDHILEESSCGTIIIGDEVADTFDCTLDRTPWLSLQHITLVKADKIALKTESELTDMHINFAQAILKVQFSKIRGVIFNFIVNKVQGLFSLH